MDNQGTQTNTTKVHYVDSKELRTRFSTQLRQIAHEHNQKLHCEWCHRYVEKLNAGKFCTQECESKHFEYMLQSNCEWCYETIVNRFSDKYCCSQCKEKHMYFLQSEEKRFVFAKIACFFFFLVVMLPLALLEYVLLAYMYDFNVSLKIFGWLFPICYVVIQMSLPVLKMLAYSGTYAKVDRKPHTSGLMKYIDYPRIGQSGHYIDGFDCPHSKCFTVLLQLVELKQANYAILLLAVFLPLSILLEYVIGYSFGYKESMVWWATGTICAVGILVTNNIQKIRENLMLGNLTEDKRRALDIAFDILLEENELSCDSGNTPEAHRSQFLNLCQKSPEQIFAMAKSKVDQWYLENVELETERLYYKLHDELSSQVKLKVLNVKYQKDDKHTFDCVFHLNNTSRRTVRVNYVLFDGYNSKVYIGVVLNPHETCEVHVKSHRTNSVCKNVSIRIESLSVLLDTPEPSYLTIHLSSVEKFNYSYDEFLQLIGQERPIPA